MSTTYTVIMQDDNDFSYVNRTKRQTINKIKKEFFKEAGFYPDVLGSWYGRLVLRCGKFPIYIDECKKVILDNCDSAYWWDTDSPWIIKELN